MSRPININGVQVDVWNAVSAAVDANMSVERFMEIARVAWSYCMEYKAQVADFRLERAASIGWDS